MIKKKASRILIVVACTVLLSHLLVFLLFPFSLEYALRLLHIPFVRGSVDAWILYFSGCLFGCAGFLQFPFREDEAWFCACGYNLSYINPKAKRCPECGEQLAIEWTATPGVLSSKTKARVRRTIILFILAGILVAVPTCQKIGKGRPRSNYIGLSPTVLSYTVNNFSLSKIISSREVPTIS